jgi:outer membrane protein TolC
MKAASLAEGLAGWTRADAEARLRRDIRTGFYDLLLARAAVKVREESLGQIESLVARTEQRFKSGAASEFDVLSAKVRVANEKPEVIRARNLRDVGMEGFRTLVGLPDGAFEVDGELSCEPLRETLEDLCRRASCWRPALRGAEMGARLKEQDLAAAKAGYLPSVNTFFNYAGSDPYGFSMTDGGMEWHWNAGVALRWDLWDGGLTRGLVTQKRLELDKLRSELEDFRKLVKLEVTQAYLDMTRALDTIEAGRGNVALAQKALGIAKTRYDTGLSTYLEFTDANLALRTAELTLYNALRDHMNAVARLKYAAGMEDKPGKEEKKP